MVTKAILLAGGRGTRLFPLTNDLPKPLLPIDNIPTLSRILRQLEKTDIRRATLTVGYLGEAIAARYGGLFRTLHLDYAYEQEPLGTAGAVRAAAFSDAQNARDPDDILVLSGDALFEGDLSALIDTHYRHGNDVTLAAKLSEDVSGYGVILGQNARIEAFYEKPDPASTPSHLINAGIYLLSRRVLEEIPDGRCDFARELFPSLLEKGYRLGYHVFDEYWCDIGTPKSYLEANLRYTGGKSAIGNQCRIAPSALLSADVLFDGVTLGEGVSVKNSILCRGVTLSDGVALVGSVVAAGCVLTTSPPPGSLVLADENGLVVRPLESGLLLPVN